MCQDCLNFAWWWAIEVLDKFGVCPGLPAVIRFEGEILEVSREGSSAVLDDLHVYQISAF